MVNCRGLATQEMANGLKWVKTNERQFDVYLNHEDKLAYIGYIPVDYNSVSMSTDIKDKNNLEVYDGDIVKYNPLYERLCVIKITPYTIIADDFYSEFILDSTDMVEIVGNIYENPELLEEIAR